MTSWTSRTATSGSSSAAARAATTALRSISRSIGTKDYLRARFGIGRPPGRMDPAAFVLRDFAAAERKELPVLLEEAADAVELTLADGLAVAQNRSTPRRVPPGHARTDAVVTA